MGANEPWAGRVVIVIVGLLIGYAAARVLGPFVPVLAAAAIIAVVARPLQARLERRFSPGAASGLVCALVCLILAVPLSLGGWFLARESVRAYPVVRRAIEGATSPAAEPPEWLPGPARDYLRDLDVKDVLLENVRELGTWSGRVAGSAVANAAALAADLLIFALGLFFFLRDGARMLERLTAAAPLRPGAAERIKSRARDMIVATVEGVFAIAVLQGVLSTIGFALFGVRFPALLGALCMALSPIPLIGPTLVWLPVVIARAIEGQIGRAILMAAWFALVVGTSDNVVRPILIGTRARLPIAVVVAGVLGGLEAFGPIGTLLGPVIMALVAAVSDILLEEAGRERA